MIRPLTFVALLLACTSGLYLYQTKHRAEVLDGQITHTLRQVAAARERIGLLRAEWALLNEPDRLGQLAGQHLELQPLQPSRFVAAADLASRIPLPAAPEAPAPMASAEMPVAEDTPASPPTDLVRVVDATPVQAAAPAPVAAAAPRPTLVAAAHVPSPPQPRPAPSRPAERAWTVQRETAQRETAQRETVATPPARRPVYAPVLRAMATPIAAPSLGVTQVRLVTTRPSAPVVTSALGGFGRSSLAPPIPVEGR